jgi:hypothetical protein
MSIKSREELSDEDLAQAFLRPANATHRQYEALRAYFVDKVPYDAVAVRFGYTPGSFRVLCSEFRTDPTREFFLPVRRGPQATPERDVMRETVIEMRKQNLSIYDISRRLQKKDRRLSPAGVALILKEAGFSKLPRRADEDRPDDPRVDPAEPASVELLDLSTRDFHTQFGGLFLFVPFLAQIPLESMLEQASFPGSQQIPPAHAMRALLAMKLFGKARHSHVMSSVFDEGLALFAGLNVTPKRSFLTQYSTRIEPEAYSKLMSSWFDAMRGLGLESGSSFDVDFHTIPHHGEDALLQKHYVSKRSRRQKGVLAFLAQDAGKRVFCYANAALRKEDQNDEVLHFVEYWKQRTGRLPEELVFDSRLTTYTNLDKLNKMGVQFITLRRRDPSLVKTIDAIPKSAWRKIELKSIARAYRTPKIFDHKATLADYDGPIRQLFVTDLGHEEPTIVITNQLDRSATTLIGRYAQRMIIENGISDGVEFFHMDALSSAVAMNVNCDIQLTLMASSLYRLLGERIGNGYATAKSQHIFRDFIEAVADVYIFENDIHVRFQKRAHNPLLLAAGFHKLDLPVPWLGGRRLRLHFGEGDTSQRN